MKQKKITIREWRLRSMHSKCKTEAVGSYRVQIISPEVNSLKDVWIPETCLHQLMRLTGGTEESEVLPLSFYVKVMSSGL